MRSPVFGSFMVRLHVRFGVTRYELRCCVCLPPVPVFGLLHVLSAVECGAECSVLRLDIRCEHIVY